jgi:hypothetical protein
MASFPQAKSSVSFFLKVEVMRYIIHKYLRFSIITAFIKDVVVLYRTKNWTKFELVDPGLLSLVFVVQTFILFNLFYPANLVYFAEI